MKNNWVEFYKNKQIVFNDKIFKKRNKKLFFLLKPFLEGLLSHRGMRVIVLDTGAGFGIDILTLYENINSNNIYYLGLEISSSQVIIAKKYFNKINIKNVDFIIGDCTQLPFKDESCDIVISNQVIEHINKQKEYLQEIYRVLKKGGILLITAPNRIFPYEGHISMPFIPWLPKNLACMLLRFIDNEKSTYYEHVYPISVFHLEKLLKKVGFETKYVTSELLSYEELLLDFEIKIKNRYKYLLFKKVLNLYRFVRNYNVAKLLIKYLIKIFSPYSAFVGVKNG